MLGGDKLSLISKKHQSKTPFLDNKLLFNIFMNNLNFNTPEIYGYSLNGKILNPYSEEVICENSLKHSIEKLMTTNCLNKLFIKPINDQGGKECFLYSKNDNKFSYKKLSSGFLFQEFLEQNKKINKIYPYSINTIRINTFKNDKDDIKIVSAFMRFGANKNNVDNASSGGFFVPINIERGKLEGIGVSLLKHGGNTYSYHPDTGFKFKDFKIPKFREVVYSTVEASKYLDNTLIGWDIAITNDGIVFIEGNSNGSLLMSQIACGGFKRHPIWSKLL